MAYNTIENSVQGGEPVELYEFQHGPNFYRYTSTEADVVFDAQTFTAATLSRSSIEATQEIARGGLTLSCARTLSLLALFNPVPPSEVITVTIRRFHRGDTEAAVIWIGRVLNVAWRGLQAEIRCESVYSSMKRPGLRRMYQKQCPHVLFSLQCGLNKDTYRVTTSVVSVAGLLVAVASLGAVADGHFAGGWVEWSPEPGIVERRAIRGHTGNTLQLNFQPLGLPPGASIDVFPGCDHTLGTCAAKFANTPNYGGMPYIPTKNPFDGTPVF